MYSFIHRFSNPAPTMWIKGCIKDRNKEGRKVGRKEGREVGRQGRKGGS